MPIISILWNHSPPPGFGVAGTFDASRSAAMSARPARSALTFGWQPTSASYAGDLQPMFGGDFYERWHFSALEFDFGNLIGEQSRSLTVWNAHRRARILESITLTPGQGITIGGQPPAPLQFAPQQLRAYEIVVSIDGPPTIDATILFDFDEGQLVPVAVSGSRVTAWTWRPDWGSGMLERIEWMTDVIQAYRGEEQSRSLRLDPRQQLEFGVLADGAERRHLESVLWNWGARVWAVPLWYDGVEMAALLPAGSTSIPVSTATRGFSAGGLALILGQTSRDYEVIEVDVVNPSEIVLARPTTSAWPVGSMLCPARAARIEGSPVAARFTGRASDMRLRFEMVDPVAYTADAGATTYRGYPVLTDRPDWSEEPALTFERKLFEFDPGTGAFAVEDEAQMPLTQQSMRWLFVERAEVDRRRKLLHALRGKQGRIWVPTWTDDLIVTASIGNAALAIDVEWCGYSLYLAGDVQRRDIRIETTSGLVLYRRITSSSEINPTTERLIIDTALGVDLDPIDIVQVSFLSLCRQASDAAEFGWFTGASAMSSTTMKAIRHDV